MKRGERAFGIPSLAQSHVAHANDTDVLHRPSHSYGGSSSSSQNLPILELVNPFLSRSLTGQCTIDCNRETQLHIALLLRPLPGTDSSRYLHRTIRYDVSIHRRDEDEGSVKTTSWHGPSQSYLPDLCPRTLGHAGVHNGFHGASGSRLECYLAGWHIKPKGVKKLYNPVLCEFFRCRMRPRELLLWRRNHTEGK